MLIKVTQEHIDKGVRGNECKCPIALALKGTSKDVIVVGGCTISVGRVDYPIPLSARVFICEFDNGYCVKPFEFELI